MNKHILFLAFAVFALVACSEDKPEPTQSDICTKPITKKCLIGNWYLARIEGGNTDCSPDALKDNSLKFEANGQFSFKGNYNYYEQGVNIETFGDWELNGTEMKINCKVGDCDPIIVYPIDANIDVRNTGQRLELRISTKGYTGFLQCSVGNPPNPSTDFTEVFVWRGK
jgi:hypothetical protein